MDSSELSGEVPNVGINFTLQSKHYTWQISSTGELGVIKIHAKVVHRNL